VGACKNLCERTVAIRPDDNVAHYTGSKTKVKRNKGVSAINLSV